MKAAQVGNNRIPISHLQYADDTVFLCSKEKENIQVIKQILRLFKLISGLKVNFDKSKLFGVNIYDRDLEEGANLIGCAKKTGQLTYLGMRIGLDHHRCNSWSWLIQKVKNRVAK